VLGRLNRRSQSRYRSVALAAAGAIASTALTACGGGAGGATTINWYINPDSSGATQKVQAACNQQAAGRYQIAISVLPATADGQREQLVRRLAAKDSSIDLMSVDPPYMPELANAGWLQAFDETQKSEVLKDILKSPVESATWKGELVGAPYSANTQLLWYRKSVAQKAGIDPTKPDFTWDEMLDAALKTNTTIAEQGLRYEGYMVWVNALIEGAGGHILTDNEKGRDATVSVDSDAGRKAAALIQKIASSKAADPALSTSKEEQARASFDSPNGGFLLNWPYSYAATQGNVKDGSVPQSVFDDIAWARYPRVDKSTPSRPPLGGVNLAISKFSVKKANAYDALKCIIAPPQSKTKMLILGDPSANSTVYDDPEIRKAYPMADLMRESINDAGPRPVTPFYGDVSSAIQREWHPPAAVNDDSVKSSAKLIGDVLHDRRLL
jgi:multiple sugar transport system substrate-binding protein